MSLRLHRPLRNILAGLRVNFTESGIEGRGAWSGAQPPGIDTTADSPDAELPRVIVGQSQNPARSLGLMLLMVVLAALAFVVAAQG